MSEAEILWEDVSREAGLTRGERERLGVGEAIVIEPGSKREAQRVGPWIAE